MNSVSNIELNISTTEWTALTPDMYDRIGGSFWIVDHDGDVIYGEAIWIAPGTFAFALGADDTPMNEVSYIMKLEIPKPPAV